MIRNARHARDPRPVDEACACYTCRHFSRGALRHLVAGARDARRAARHAAQPALLPPPDARDPRGARRRARFPAAAARGRPAPGRERGRRRGRRARRRQRGRRRSSTSAAHRPAGRRSSTSCCCGRSRSAARSTSSCSPASSATTRSSCRAGCTAASIALGDKVADRRDRPQGAGAGRSRGGPDASRRRPAPRRARRSGRSREPIGALPGGAVRGAAGRGGGVAGADVRAAGADVVAVAAADPARPRPAGRHAPPVRGRRREGDRQHASSASAQDLERELRDGAGRRGHGRARRARPVGASSPTRTSGEQVARRC